METYKCKFCSKRFINERSLGNHMENLHKVSVDKEEEERPSQLSYETESNVSSSSSSSSEDEKRKLVNLEDGESEIESSRRNMTRKRSKRTRKLGTFVSKKKKKKTSQLGYKTESKLEPPYSSASDTTTEKDLAFCLMMLSRDKSKGRFKCETCGKVFKSYQALGGHRASHKKNRDKTEQRRKTEQRSETEYDDDDNVVVVEEKRIYECPICFRVFASGQALGGHKRSHGIGNHNQVHNVKQRMIDLNLPASNEEDDVSLVFQ